MLSSQELNNIDDATELENRTNPNDSLINTRNIIIALGALVVASVVVAYSFFYMNSPNSESPATSVPIFHRSEPFPVSNPDILPAAFTQDTPVEEYNPIFFIAANRLYSIDPNAKILNVQIVSDIPASVSIHEKDPIFYDAENVYFQDRNVGYCIHAIKLLDLSSYIVLENITKAWGFALNKSVSSGIYFNQPNNMTKLQYFDFGTELSETHFMHKCNVRTHYPKIILNSNNGSKLFYKCIPSISLNRDSNYNSYRNSVFIHDLRDPHYQGLQSFDLFHNNRFILSPDDKYVIMFSHLCSNLNIFDITKNTSAIKTFYQNSEFFDVRRIFFSKTGSYLYILDKHNDSDYILHKIDFANLSKALEAENVKDITFRQSPQYILSIRKIKLP